MESPTSRRVFVSYSRLDAEFALRLGRDLRQAGANLWIDQLDIPPGGRWDREVEAALKGCEHLIVILSPESVASENVMDEVGYALQQGKRVFPVVHAPCDVPFRLERVQRVDLSADYAAGVRRLVQTLADAGSARVDPLRRDDPLAPRRTGTRTWVVAGGAIAALAAAGVLSFTRRGAEPVAPVRPVANITLPPAPAPPATAPDPSPPDAALPFFMTRPVSDADLVGMSAQAVDLMRNEIYARHGRRFARRDLQAYFDQQPWYRPRYDADTFPNDALSKVQRDNALFLQSYASRRAQR